MPGTGVVAKRGGRLNGDRVQDVLAELSTGLERLGPPWAAAMRGLVVDLLLAGVAHVRDQVLLPHALMFDALWRLSRHPAGLMQHLGYLDVPPVDESFPRRLARFGLLYLPRGVAEAVAAGELFTITLDSEHLPNALAAAAGFGSGSAHVTAEPGGDAWQLGAVPAVVLVAALDRMVSAVAQQFAENRPGQGGARGHRPADLAGSQTAHQEVATAQEFLQTTPVEIRRLAGLARSKEVDRDTLFFMDDLVRSLERLSKVAWRALGQQTDGATSELVTLFPAAAQVLADDPQANVPSTAGRLLADMRGDVEMPVGRAGQAWEAAFLATPTTMPGDQIGQESLIDPAAARTGGGTWSATEVVSGDQAPSTRLPGGPGSGSGGVQLVAPGPAAAALADPTRPVGWSAAELDGLFDAESIQIWATGGRVNVWFPRDKAEADDTGMAEAVARAVVPAGFAATVWVHGVAGVAYLWGRPVDATVVVGWLRGRNIVGDVFLPGCELLTPDRAGGFGAHWRNAARSLVRATETYGWLDPATGQTVAAPADERGWPVFNATGAPAGWYYDLPGAGEPAVRAPSDSPLPDRAADWRMLTASVNSIVDFSAPASSRPVHGASGEAPADGGGARDGFPGQSTSRGSGHDAERPTRSRQEIQWTPTSATTQRLGTGSATEPAQSTSRGARVTTPNDRREADMKSNGLPHPPLRNSSALGAPPRRSSPQCRPAPSVRHSRVFWIG